MPATDAGNVGSRAAARLSSDPGAFVPVLQLSRADAENESGRGVFCCGRESRDYTSARRVAGTPFARNS
jgi:hypothetical protein